MADYITNKNPVEIKLSEFKKLDNVNELLQKAELIVTKQDETLGDTDVTDECFINPDSIDTKQLNQVQQIPIYVKVNRSGATTIVDYLSLTLTKSNISSALKAIGIVLAVVIVILFFGGLHQHHVNQQGANENNQQNAAISSNQHQLAKDESSIRKLKMQVAQLKQALADFKENQNKQELNNQIENVKNELAETKQQDAQQSAMFTALYNQLINALNKLENASGQQVDSVIDKYGLDKYLN